jgi:hypothetical protein
VDQGQPAAWPITPSSSLELRQLCDRGQNSFSAEGEFKTKRLNIWIGAASAWLNVSQWIACSDQTLRLSDFRGLDCYIGADLADKDDITAIALAAIDGAGRLLLKTWFFVPDAALDRADPASKQIVELYRQWKNGRWLWTTRGDFVDHNRVERLIRRLHKVLNVKKITFDQFAAAQAMASRSTRTWATATNSSPRPAEERRQRHRPAKDLEARVKGRPQPTAPRRQPGDDVDGRQRGRRARRERVDPAEEGDRRCR